jgi:chaperonin GroES
MNIIPLNNNVLIERLEKKSKTEGGIILPDIAKEKPKEGNVIAVGAGKYQNGILIMPRVQKGQRVMFSAFSGSEMVVDNKEYFMIAEEDILAVIEQGEQA